MRSFFFVYRIDPRIISLNIPKAKVNDFLGRVWDEFEAEFGKVACQHFYKPGSSPEIYLYTIRWTTRQFEAVLNFVNHTSKGLTSFELRFFDLEKDTEFGERADRIASAVRKVSAEMKSSVSVLDSLGCFAKVGVVSPVRLSGNFYIEDLELMLLQTEYGFELVFPSKLRKVPAEFNYESRKIAAQHVAMLTLLTQHFLLLSEEVGVERVYPEEFQDMLKTTLSSGTYIFDEPLFGPEGKRLGMPGSDGGRANIKEVIMMSDSDFRVKGAICLPEKVGLIMKHIQADRKRLQACKRFQDALRFRQVNQRFLDGTFGLSYELVAYVAAIEAVLDHSKVTIPVECSNCKSPGFKEDYKISQRFKDFVHEFGGGSEPLNIAFKKLYQDRSKFVHTGIELHNPNVVRPNRPLILDGKDYVRGVPSYYYNVHEWVGYILRVFFYQYAYEESLSPV